VKLSEYFNGERGRQAELVKAIKGHAPDVSRWADGKRPVPIPMAPKIEHFTNGLVTRKDLRPDDYQEIWPDLREPTSI